MRFIKADLKRALTEPRFFLAVILGILCVTTSAAIILQGDVDDGYALFTKSHSLLLPFVAPLLCALPYATMDMLDTETGFAKLMTLHYGHKTWVFGRFLVNAFVSGLTVLLPGLVLLGMTLAMDDTALCLEVWQVLGLNFAFGMAFGSASYGLGFVNVQRYIPLLAPQVLYWFAIYALPILDVSQYLPPLAFSPWILPSVYDLGNMAMLLTAIAATGIVLSLLGRVRKAVGV